jgi:hypothetical protein
MSVEKGCEVIWVSKNTLKKLRKAKGVLAENRDKLVSPEEVIGALIVFWQEKVSARK